MPKQPAFPDLLDLMKKKQARRERFWAEMDAVVPWVRLVTLLEPHYPKPGSKGGRPPVPLETMLWVYFLQRWYALSDPMAEEASNNSEAMRRFADIGLGDDRISDDATILNFLHLQDRHRQTEAIFADVNGHLADKGVTLRSVSLLDAAIVDAPSSTTNKDGARYCEMSPANMGNDWFFGLKAYIGVDADTGATHRLDSSRTKMQDSQVWNALLHGGEASVRAGKPYATAKRKAAFQLPGKAWGCHAQRPDRRHAASLRRRDQRDDRKGQASVPGDLSTVRPREDALSHCHKEPSPALHAVRGLQPGRGARASDDMKASLPESRHVAQDAASIPRGHTSWPEKGVTGELRPQFRRIVAADR